MRPATPITGSRRGMALLVAASLAACVAFLTYRHVLEYDFTGTDTLTLIETGRIRSVEDLADVLTRPLMWQSEFIARGRFFRPVATLSYSLDYAAWGMGPFGYHCTDLILHVLVAGLVALLMGNLAGGDPFSAAACGVIFAMHPILVETVPAPAHRHDVLAAAFTLLSLITFLRAGSGEQRNRGMQVLSVVMYLLALGAKELMVFLPVLFGVYRVLFSRAPRLSARSHEGLKAALPYLAVTAIYLAWRTAVLGGLGGYASEAPDNGVIETLLAISRMYLRDLLYPQDIFSIVEGVPACVLAGGLLGLLGVSCLVLARSGAQSGGKTVGFLAAWVCAPLPVFLLTSTFSHRSMYACVIPLAGILGLALVSGARALTRTPSPDGADAKSGAIFRNASRNPSVSAGFVAALVLVGTLAWSSPLLRTYQEWADSSTMTKIFLDRLAAAVPKLEDNTTIDLHGLPAAIQRYRAIVPRARDVGYPIEYGVASWLRLLFPTRKLKVVVHSRFCPEQLPTDLQIRLQTEEAGRTAAVVTFVGAGGRLVPGRW